MERFQKRHSRKKAQTAQKLWVSFVPSVPFCGYGIFKLL
jgi:hypothetical protein